MKKYFLILFFSPTFLFSQQSKIDSLLLGLKYMKKDTNQVNTLNKISKGYCQISEYDSALIYAETAKQLAIKIKYKKGLSISNNVIGNIFLYQGDYPNSIKYYFEALKIAEELKDKNQIGVQLVNIGNVYKNQTDYSKGLEYYQKSLKLFSEVGDSYGVSISLGNIGNIYNELAEDHTIKIVQDSLYNLALDYHLQALKIDEGLGNNNGIARQLSNIGTVYNT